MSRPRNKPISKERWADGQKRRIALRRAIASQNMDNQQQVQPEHGNVDSYSGAQMDRMVTATTVHDYRRNRKQYEGRKRKEHSIKNPRVDKISYEDKHRTVTFACVCVVDIDLKDKLVTKRFFCKDHRETQELRSLIETTALRSVR